MTMQLGEALLHALKAHDAREVFGIPGDFALPFFKVIEDSGILPLYTFSHEPAVGFAADAAARANSAMGVAGQPEITDLVERSDGLLLLGVILSDTNFGISHRQIDMRRAIQALGRQVRIGYHVYLDIPLDALVDALLGCTVAASARPARRAPKPDRDSRDFVADGAPITPSDIARAVNDAMARHGPMPMASDVGHCLFVAMEIAHTRLAAPGYYAGMGFGVPGGLGIQATTGERPLILVGDGAFQMTGWEHGNCRRYGWGPIVLVLNNMSWEMLRTFQPESRFNDLDDWHFAEIAAPLGGRGERVTTRAELKGALARAVSATGRFSLIEIMLARGVISETLSRYLRGFQQRSEARLR